MTDGEIFAWFIVATNIGMGGLLLKDSRQMLKRQVELVEAINAIVETRPPSTEQTEP